MLVLVAPHPGGVFGDGGEIDVEAIAHVDEAAVDDVVAVAVGAGGVGGVDVEEVGAVDWSRGSVGWGGGVDGGDGEGGVVVDRLVEGGGDVGEGAEGELDVDVEVPWEDLIGVMRSVEWACWGVGGIEGGGFTFAFHHQPRRVPWASHVSSSFSLANWR